MRSLLPQALAAPGCSELFDWLRTIPSDGDFQAAVEMAMGRSELETPPELWVAEGEGADEPGDDEQHDKHDAMTAADEPAPDGTALEALSSGAAVVSDTKGGAPLSKRGGGGGGLVLNGMGRPDEEKLSMLGAIRTRFHKLLYRDDSDAKPPLVFDSLAEALDLLAGPSHPSPSSSSSSSSSSQGSSFAGGAEESARLAGALRSCVRLRVPLQELLGDDSDNTAPNRLQALLQPSWSSKWVIETSHAAGGDKHSGSSGGGGGSLALADVVRLEYAVPRRGRTIAGSQSLPELLDFQSACVLAKTSSGDAAAAAIDTFTSQFRWLQETGRAVLMLHAAGHFAYQVFRLELPLADASAASAVASADSAASGDGGSSGGGGSRVGFLVELALSKRRALAKWTQRVSAARDGGEAVNYFTMGEVWRLVQCLDEHCGGSGGNGDSGASVASLHRGIAAALSALEPAAQLPQGSPLVATFAAVLVKAWRKELERGTAASVDPNGFSGTAVNGAGNVDNGDDDDDNDDDDDDQRAVTRLRAASSALDAAFASVRGAFRLPRCRTLGSSRALGGAGSGSSGDGGNDKHARLRLVVVQSWKDVLASSLSAFVVQRVLPEWHTLLVCDRDTPLEALRNFLRRAGAPGAPLAVLAGAHRLSLEAQHAVLEHLRGSDLLARVHSAAASPLVIVAEAPEQGRAPAPVLTQLSGFRTVDQALGQVALDKVWAEEISAPPHSRGLALLSSTKAGAGKSFEARRLAAAGGAAYVHVRINRSMAPTELAGFIQSRLRSVIAEDSAEGGESDSVDHDNGDGDGEGANSSKNKGKRSNAAKGGAVKEERKMDKEDGAPSRAVCVHLDLAETVGGDMDALLLHLLLLGCLPTGDAPAAAPPGQEEVDEAFAAPAPRFWWWDPQSTSFVVEVASPALLERLPCLSWLPRTTVAPSAASFAADAAALEAGFGARAFRDPKADGTQPFIAPSGLPREVEVVGLSARPELNGCAATVRALHDATGTYRVTVHGRDGLGYSLRLPRHSLRPRSAEASAALAQQQDIGGPPDGADSKALAATAAAFPPPAGPEVVVSDAIDLGARREWEKHHRGIAAEAPGVASSAEAPATAFERLRWVCGLLDLMGQLQGRLPVDVDACIAAAPALSGQRCFELVVEASGNPALNFWALWAFVNGTYATLRPLFKRTGVLASALSEHAAADGMCDGVAKAVLRGLLVKFACQTTAGKRTRGSMLWSTLWMLVLCDCCLN